MVTDTDRSPTALIVGGGPAGLRAAEVLALAGVAVTVLEKMPTVGRKLLMAGRGGLNLTHSEDVEIFETRYGRDAEWMATRLQQFSPIRMVEWARDLGIETFVGSSGRVFPASMKASPLLRAWLARLRSLGVKIVTGVTWLGWDAAGGTIACSTADGSSRKLDNDRFDVTVLALGGASWPRLGADGVWAEVLRERGVAIAEFEASNAAARVVWSDYFKSRHAGVPLKRLAARIGDKSLRGEAVITQGSIEGGLIYALNTAIRDALQRGAVTLRLDLKPDLEFGELKSRLSRPRGKQSLANFLRKAVHLAPVQVALLRECIPELASFDADRLALAIKDVPVRIEGLAGLDRAISSAGGVRLDEIEPDMMLREVPGVFVAGEMLDWDAPTGGYLLQGCFATGQSAANGALAWLRRGGRSWPSSPP